MKRGPAEPWIGEIIVVKEYDQMDSLREILDLPARVNGPTAEDDNSSSVENVSVDNTVEHVVEQTSTTAECGIKRKLEEEMVDESPSEPEIKRQRVMSPSSLCESPKKTELSTRVINPEKENVPPFDVLCFLKSADRVDG